MFKKQPIQIIFFLILCSLIFCNVIIVSADNESLYVDGFNVVNEQWDETGLSPWLNDNDANYISTSVNGEIHEDFTFEDPAGSDTINNVTLYIQLNGPSARNDYVEIEVYNGSWFDVVHQDPDDDAYTWYNYDVSDQFRTWNEITNAKLRVIYQRSGSPATQTIYVRRSYLYVDYTPAGANADPVNDQASISNMDDGDNLYAQYKTYTIDYDGHDTDGYADIDYILLNITQDAAVRASFRYDEDTNTFSIIDGNDSFDLIGVSCSASRAGDNVNLTIGFQVEWDATQENDCELYAYIVDDEPASDTDQLQYNYVDILTNLVTSFSIDDDRGNTQQSITASGTITYQDSALFPSDSEFSVVSVYDSLNNNEGNDNTVVNGAWSVNFNAPATIGLDTYNLFINLVDANYTDGEESTTDTFITDQQQLQTLATNNTNPDVDQPVLIWSTAQSPYDNHVLAVGDTLVLKDSDSNTYTFTYNGSHWTYIGSWGSGGSITLDTYDSVIEITFSVTILDMNGLSLSFTVNAPPIVGFSLTLQVIDSLNVSLSDISVRIINSTTEIFNGVTNATGFIPDQTISGGNYTIIITETDYIPQEIDIRLIGNIYLIVKLFTVEEVELMPFDTPLLVIASLATVFTGIGMLSKDSNKSGSGSVLGMLFWGACWGYWIIQHSTTDVGYFAWVFVAPFFICIFNAWDAVFKEADKGFGRNW